MAEVYPEQVVRDAAVGRLESMRYDGLAPMLLNQMQKINAAQAQQMAAQATINAGRAERIVAQGAPLRDMQKQLANMHAALVKLQTKVELVVQR